MLHEPLDEQLDVRILGPLEVVRGRSGAVATLPPKQRSVLALLALHVGRVVSEDQVVDSIWGEDPPAAVRSSLHAHVSRLRQAIGGGTSVVAGRPGGYTLCVATDSVDVRRFESRLGEGRRARNAGRAADAAEDLRAALDAWRGVALQDVVAPFVEPARVRLDELRAIAEEDLLHVDLELGRAEAVASRSAVILESSRYREAVWTARAIALHRLGRTADALAALSELRRVLRDDLGLDASPAIADLEHQLLVHDPAVAAPSTAGVERSGEPRGRVVTVDREPTIVPTVRYATASDGVSVAYQVVGEGPVDLVVAQSYVWQCEVGWEHPEAATFWNALARRHRVLLYDKRSQGLSDRVWFRDMFERARDVRAVLDAAGSRRAVLIGNSDGAPIVAAAAAGDPRVAGLILVGTTLAPYDADRPWGPTPEQYRRWVDRAAATWGTGNALDVLAPSHADDPLTIDWFGRLERAACGPGDVRRLIDFIADQEWSALAAAVEVPTLLVRRADEMITREALREVADAIPGSRLVEVPGDEHLLYLGDHRPLVAEIEAFVASCVERSVAGSGR